MTTASDLPAWSLCIATLNRQDALLQTLRCAMAQEAPPAQVVVVDVSDNWQETAALAEALLERSGIALHYQTSEIRSSAVQRNLGIAVCSTEIIFLLDDDSFMFPNCSAEILKIYAADTDHAVSGVAARLVPDLPPMAAETLMPARARTAHAANVTRGSLKQRLRQSRAGQWFLRKVLFQSKDEIFITYEGPRETPVPPTVADLAVSPLTFMPGSAMTVRRAVALEEPFDPALRYYAAAEDADATYRFGRHGRVLQANRAKLHHYKAAGGRVRRDVVIALQLLNMAVFIKRHAADPDRLKSLYRRQLRRRLLAEFLKDLLSRRFHFPQVKGVFIARGLWQELWARDSVELETWYPEVQKSILNK